MRSLVRALRESLRAGSGPQPEGKSRPPIARSGGAEWLAGEEADRDANRRMWEHGGLAQAEKAAQELLAAAEAKFGQDSYEYMEALRVLARLNHQMGRRGEAARLYADLLACWERIYGPQYLDVLEPLEYLAQRAREDGHPEQAKPLLERATVIAHELLGPRSRQFASLRAQLHGQAPPPPDPPAAPSQAAPAVAPSPANTTLLYDPREK